MSLAKKGRLFAKSPRLAGGLLFREARRLRAFTLRVPAEARGLRCTGVRLPPAAGLFRGEWLGAGLNRPACAAGDAGQDGCGKERGSDRHPEGEDAGVAAASSGAAEQRWIERDPPKAGAAPN
jgi:hypothetical protein